MRLARIGEVDVPDGGVVAVDDEGRPNGLLEEQAQQLVRSLVHPRSVAEMATNLGLASDRYLSEGITSCQEAGVGGILGTAEPVEVAAYQQARRANRLRVRVTMMASVDALHGCAHHADDNEPFSLDLGMHTGFGDDWLRYGATKIFADGSLMGCTAAMFEDFRWSARQQRLLPDARSAAARTDPRRAPVGVAGRHPRDRRPRRLLRCSTRTRLCPPAAPPSGPPAPHRTCRDDPCCQTSHRIARLGVIPVPQARFVSEIGDGMLRAIGPDRVGDCYRQRSFLDAGITLPGSSDRPVVNGAPLLGIHDLVNQRTASGAAFNPSEALTIEQAIHAYTVGSATASFDEQRKGSITAGKLADLVVLDHDLTAIERDGIGEARVLATMVGGSFEYDAANLA